MTRTAKESLNEGYVAGLLAGLKSIRDMVATGLLGLSLSYSCRLMKETELVEHCHERLASAPAGGYLAVDYVKVKHEGEKIEGVDRQYSHQGVIWGHRLLSSAVVYTDGRDPYVLSLQAAVTEVHASDIYPYLNGSEAMLSVAGEASLTDYELKGVVVDAEFTTKLSLRSLVHMDVGIIGRFRSNTNVSYQGQSLQARHLAKQFPVGKARYYRKLKCYAKRINVALANVGLVDLVIIWYANRHKLGWKLCILVSTLKDHGVQALIKAFKARWGLEVSHRTLKQNLALASSQCLSFTAQLRHADFCVSAWHKLRELRQLHPGLSWKQAQQLAAKAAKDALVTDTHPISPQTLAS